VLLLLLLPLLLLPSDVPASLLQQHIRKCPAAIQAAAARVSSVAYSY
jgi:hypothetical protein